MSVCTSVTLLLQIYDLLGLPRDLLLRYKAGLEAVQPGDLLKAGERCTATPPFHQLMGIRASPSIQ